MLKIVEEMQAKARTLRACSGQINGRDVIRVSSWHNGRRWVYRWTHDSMPTTKKDVLALLKKSLPVTLRCY